MAGTVANYNPEYYETLGRMHYNPNSLRNMEENDVLNNLSDGSKESKTEVLQKLRNAARKNGGKLPYVDQQVVFRGLALALTDSNWEIRHQCIQLIHEIIPDFGDGLDRCMGLVLPKLVSTMGDSKISIRRAVIQTLHVYMKTTNDVHQLFKCIVQYGIENSDPKVKKEIVVSLPMLFTPEFGQEDFFEIARALLKRLLDAADDNLKTHVLLSLEKIRDLVGDAAFQSYLDKVSAPLRRYYNKLAGREESLEDHTDHVPMSGPASNKAGVRNAAGTSSHQYYDSHPHSNGVSHYSENDVEFGVVPSQVMARLNDQSNFRNRAQAVEDLKNVIDQLSDISPLEPHVLKFISFLNNLLDDSNFKITTVTLEILGLVVQKLQGQVKTHLKALIMALTKRMGDNKIVVRQAIMKVVMRLMQILSPKPVLTVICDNLSHKNSRVRQETLNLTIASLLTFPSSYFDLGSLCQRVAPSLVDLKRPVRQAALECFAVLASDMGAGRLQPLVQAVDSVELSYEGDGAMAAVQARLARRQLPKLNSERLVEYATPLPASATARGMSQGADIDWILSASSGGGSSAHSARSTSSDILEIESITSSSARSTPTDLDHYSQQSTPRRHPSGKKKASGMPWDMDSSAKGSTAKQSKQPKDMMGTDLQKAALQRKKERQEKTVRESPTTQRGYRQIHSDKIHRQMSDVPPSQPFSVYNSRDDGNDGKDGRTNFASTWHDSSSLDEAKKYAQNKRYLDPISAPEVPSYVPNWNDSREDEKGKCDQSPIPLKPKLVRGSSSRRKVPPISDISGESYDGQDSARDSVLSGMLDDDNRDEIDNSLRQIRNSATKKKVQKMFGQLDNMSRSPSPPSSLSDAFEDSGMFSQISTLRSNFDETDNTTVGSHKKKKKELPFENKPKLPVRKVSKGEVEGKASQSDVTSTANYKPFGGVTFKENRDADVAIVGKGYGEDSQQADPKPSQYAQKARDRRKQSLQKGSMLSPLAMASQHSVGSMDMDDDTGPAGVVGKGVFDGSTDSTPPVRRSSRTESDVHNLPPGVYGVGVRQGHEKNNSPDDDDFYDDDDYEDEEDVSSMSMSMTMRMRLGEERERKEQAEKERQAEEEEIERRKRDVERERLRRQQEAEKERTKRQQEHEARKRDEERKRLIRLAKPVEDDVDGSMGTSPSKGEKHIDPPQQQPSPASVKRPPKPMKAMPEKVVRSPTNSARNEEESGEELKPFRDPEAGLREAYKQIENSDWEIKCNGLTCLRRIILHHSHVLTPQLHTVILKCLGEVKNLRSQVSRLAIVTMGDLYLTLRKGMDQDLDQSTKVLLAKYGESNGFIHDDVNKALEAMVENTSPQRAMLALIAGGASHKNPHVRSGAVRLLCVVVERQGPGRVLSGVKDLTEKILPVAAPLVLDGSPETRYYAQKILYMLMFHEDFDKMMKKHVSSTVLRNIQDRLDQLKRKGLGDPPSENGSARPRRSGQGTRSNSSTRNNSASSHTTDGGSASSSGLRRGDEERLSRLKEGLSSNEWRDRQEAIMQLRNMCESNPQAVTAQITKVFDRFVPCLKDSNSKVCLLALSTMKDITEVLKEALPSVLSITVPAITCNLTSKNKDIHNETSLVLDSLMENIDPCTLITYFVTQVQNSNSRNKPDLVLRVAYLSAEAYPRKSKQVRLQVLPLLWDLLKTIPTSGHTPGATGSLHSTTTSLVKSLYQHMDTQLLDIASSNSNVTPRMKQILEDMINDEK